MATKWTDEQKKVIETGHRNLLVSAAAGSGKTAVLVERIIRMITDPEHPVDIDKLLVMTFTNAAAAEMRERVETALGKLLDEDPGNKNLERQNTLIHHAKITTIDSFCLNLLREHFHELDLDPGFRVADEGELMLLKADVMKELLEEYYGREDERFIKFVDTYATGRTDGGLEEYILKVWEFSQSNPWPGEWIAACRKELRAGGTGEDRDPMEETAWMKYLIQDVKRQAEEFLDGLYGAADLAAEEDGPQAYAPMLAEDIRGMEELKEAGTYREIAECLEGLKFGRLAAVRGKNVDPEKKEQAAAYRNVAKDGIKKMKALYLPGDIDEVFADLDACREPILMLLELAEEFSARFQEAKEEKNLVDFNDLEHFALEVLTGGSLDHRPGAVADELSEIYEEILVDEYQDSNEVQETLIRCVSRERFGTPNVFMVGDVKQSIYKFRLAKPELFLEKYESYGKEDGLYQKIELHKNFRSRPEVLSSINDVFYRIMTKQLGNIKYTDDAALYPGAEFPETPVDGQAKTEVLLLNTGDPLFDGMDEEKADYTAKEAEARLIAGEIKKLTDPEHGMKIFNGKTGEYEPLKKKDIVILLRSLSGWSEEFLSVLGAAGIPAYAESRTGYFTAVEVETVLNMLALIDNPMQDIPLAGVLKSPIGGMKDRELAIVMAEFKKDPDRGEDIGFYGAVKRYMEKHGESEEDAVIYRKLAAFRNLLTTLRKESMYLPVSRLIYRVFDLTGYDKYAAAMPAGKTRQANLAMLVQKAEDYEKTSYQGLFDFIRYIEKLKKYNTDFGEASRSGEHDDAVRIMSIHKSKGLEFPVVFLAGCGKKFNRQDARGRILIDEELGIAADFFDPEKKVKAPTLKKNVLARRSNLENMGEELRILYVAMTRAKEKLIITAGDKYMDNKLEKWGGIPAGGALPFTTLSAASSYMDWILMASNGAKNTLDVKNVPVKDLLVEEAKNQEEKAKIYLELEQLRKAQPEEIPGLIGVKYPYAADLTLHAKMSVSELKEQGQFVDDAESAFLIKNVREKEDSEIIDNRSDTASEEKARIKRASDRGTAYHRALELIRFAEISGYDDIVKELDRISEEKRMQETAIDMVYPGVLTKFFHSDIAARMKQADRNGKLRKESQFVVGIPAREMDKADSDALILLQGIIDAWFEEDDGLVLVDYKTDRVKEGGENILLDRYQIQLFYYAKALTQITGKKVKEAVIYSLALQKEIPVPINL
ncbi:helicase-exonuclease AddAB subunit AddA [Clostridium sp. AM25-23AC]|uniref:helicase-exonuclease AddAB subunit AddA n=1 Tax=Clostridium sp. AM25-23AC TaxID=2305240 RepID=UPI000E4290E8|nr:helicase-exonuclease AddAB subunit AddA [Clostridium sp. AM25-23AC]RGD94511.1 helicase-exonuclease AddAB subunit AddA [Clostridium sp. AM25-23AC]